MKRSIWSCSIVVMVVACGGTSAPATSTTTTEAGGGGGEQHEHHFPAEVAAFHDQLSPLWHADAGTTRIEATCGATGELDQLAEGVQNMTAPAAVDATAWSANVTTLRTSLTTLAGNCTANQVASFDADFEAVHNAFHGLIALLPASGEQH